jgi:peptide chain release factor 2
MTPEYSETINALQHGIERAKSIEDAVGLQDGLKRIADIEAQMARPGFWDSSEKAQKVIEELKRLRDIHIPIERLSRSLRDAIELAELGASEDDASSLGEIQADSRRLLDELERIELKATLSEPHDSNNVFLSLHAGAGGTDANDWVAMMARMYERFCEKAGFQVSMIDRLEGEEAGIKSATYHVKGENAYGYLKSEIGVHRLVRKSPYDAKNRRHTSFAAVDVLPEFPDLDREIELNPVELRIDTYRAGGAGGQHVNVTDSAVRITHLPTGIVVQCQNERSQHSNRSTAMKMLKARLLREREAERERELEKLYGEKGEISWANQMRNYFLDPYQLVKDRRTGHETGNVEAVLDGDLMPFIDSYLRWKRKGGMPMEVDSRQSTVDSRQLGEESRNNLRRGG